MIRVVRRISFEEYLQAWTATATTKAGPLMANECMGTFSKIRIRDVKKASRDYLVSPALISSSLLQYYNKQFVTPQC